ncbi:N-acetyltransferase [Paraclostridium ghonii]|uniref:N-acetyltransferase n=1 Tax=Paraclostridium ghonii TaxID=29358 RepID=UPI00202D0840|nr:N-acetyltransferase [Paeniclostridium ghonii]MCM0167096.1 N-acetyltransferase [Paeniclostridium ghonii]
MIRNIENKDIDEIMDIWLKSTIKAHDFISKEYWENSYNTVKDVYIPMYDTVVYEDDEGIKGFISIINNEFIGALFVNIDFQGSGIGKKLINYAIYKYKKLNLAVYKDNKKSVEFYINRGFKIIKEQVNEDSGYNEYIMEKDCEDI